MKNLTAILLLVLSQITYSQDNSKVDSLRSVINSDISKEELVDAYVLLAQEYKAVDTDTAHIYFDKATKLADEIDYIKGKAEALKGKGLIYKDEGTHKEAQGYIGEAFQTSMAIGDTANAISLIGELTAMYYKVKDTTLYFTEFDKLIAPYENTFGYEYYDTKAKVHFRQNNYQSDSVNRFKALEIAFTLQDSFKIAESYGYRGAFYNRRGDYEKALEFFEKGIQYHEIPGFYNMLGYINQFHFYNDKLALENYLKYQELAEQGVEGARLAISNMNLGNFYWDKDTKKALEYFQKGLEIKEINQWLRSILQMNSGLMLHKLERLDEALDYYAQSEKNADEAGNRSTQVKCLCGSADVYYDKKNYDQSLSYYMNCLELFEKYKVAKARYLPYSGIGKVLLKQGKFSEAESYLDKSYEYITTIQDYTSAKNLVGWVTEVKTGMGKYQEAFDIQKQFSQLADSINNKEITRQATRMSAEFEFEQERDSIYFANEKEQLILNERITKERNRQYAAIAGVVVLIIVLTILFRYYKLKQRSNRALQTAYDQLRDTQTQLIQSEKMAAVGQLTAGIAHELNNPINAINASTTGIEADINDVMILLESYEKAEKNPDEPAIRQKIQELKADLDLDDLRQLIPEVFEDIKNGAKRMVRIIGGLTKFSRREEAEKVDMNVHQGIEETLTLIRVALKNKVDVIKNFAEDLPIIKAYPSELNQVFLNIMVNAEQAIEEHGTLTITTKQEDENIIISFKDTGHGMGKETINRIFEPFYTTKKVGLGTGLGMSISHRIVENHDGKIEVRSSEGEGTEFTVTIPI